MIVVHHALSVCTTSQSENWIVGSGATCHKCRYDKWFVELQSLEHPLEIILGDGHALETIGRGIFVLEMKLPDDKIRMCKLQDVLYVPKLSYNLLSVSKAAESGKTTNFNEAGCQILNEKKRVDCYSHAQELEVYT